MICCAGACGARALLLCKIVEIFKSNHYNIEYERLG